jgi:hypothetical protein
VSKVNPPKKLSEIEEKLTSHDPKVIDACLSFVKELSSSEQDRSQAVSGKANNVLGFAGIVATLSIPLIDMISSIRATNFCLSLVLGGLYVGMLVAIFWTIWLAFGGRTREKVVVPSIDDVFAFQTLREIDVKKKWIADLVSAYRSNIDDVNRRVTNVYRAQERLATAIILLLFLVAVAVVDKLL